MQTEALGKRIKQRRQVLGLSIRELASLTGLSKTTISQIERGASNPTLGVLQTIFEYLNLELTMAVKTVNNKT